MSFNRHLLVDGANIVNAWPELRALAKRDRETARMRLIQRLTAIHDRERVRVTVVFDGRGDELAIERPSGELTFSVIRTPSSVTADEVIEQLVAKAADAGACCVATDDRAERETVSALGATVLRSADLAAWVRRDEARQGAALEALRAGNQAEWGKP